MTLGLSNHFKTLAKPVFIMTTVTPHHVAMIKTGLAIILKWFGKPRKWFGENMA